MSDQAHILTADGVRLSIRIKGDGEQVVIVPNAIYMEDVFDSLLTGRRWVFFDLRNRGHSERITNREQLTGGINFDVDDLESVRRHLNVDRVAVIGHSYPAFIAARYAMQYPQRVSRVVLLNPMQPDLAKAYPPPLSHLDDVAREIFGALGRLQSQPSSDPVEQCRRAWDILRPLYVANPTNAARLSNWGFCDLDTERNTLRHLNEFITPSIRALTLTPKDFEQATLPVLVMHGRKDRAAPYGGGRDWAMLFPNARFIGFENVGHVPWIEAEKETFAAIDAFLGGRWPANAPVIDSSVP